jgi:hypothetical protein
MLYKTELLNAPLPQADLYFLQDLPKATPDTLQGDVSYARRQQPRFKGLKCLTTDTSERKR